VELALNKSPLNQEAKKWLKAAKESHPPEQLAVLALAFWGVEQRLQGGWPNRDRPAVEEQVNGLLGWKPANALAWVLGNPEGPDRKEQEASLLKCLREAEDPEEAALYVLEAIYDHQRADPSNVSAKPRCRHARPTNKQHHSPLSLCIRRAAQATRRGEVRLRRSLCPLDDTA